MLDDKFPHYAAANPAVMDVGLRHELPWFEAGLRTKATLLPLLVARVVLWDRDAILATNDSGRLSRSVHLKVLKTHVEHFLRALNAVELGQLNVEGGKPDSQWQSLTSDAGAPLCSTASVSAECPTGRGEIVAKVTRWSAPRLGYPWGRVLLGVLMENEDIAAHIGGTYMDFFGLKQTHIAPPNPTNPEDKQLFYEE